MMSLPSASGALFSSFIVSLHTMQFKRPISGLLSSFNDILRARTASLPLRPQLRPFQRQSDYVGACLDGANRSIQFCRDHFGAGVRSRHSSKEVILLWRPPVAHVTTIFPSPSALAANGPT